MFKKVFHFNGVILSLFAALWIITGSTVVFHQKYVYHNLLTQWQDMLLKTSAKDHKKYLKFIDKKLQSSGQPDIYTENRQNLVADIFSLPVNTITGFSSNFRPLPDCIQSLKHRGPPAA